jgi:hypothetical protein
MLVLVHFIIYEPPSQTIHSRNSETGRCVGSVVYLSPPHARRACQRFVWAYSASSVIFALVSGRINNEGAVGTSPVGTLSVINHRTLSRLLVRLGRFLRDDPMRQHPLTILSIGKAATAS